MPYLARRRLWLTIASALKADEAGRQAPGTQPPEPVPAEDQLKKLRAAIAKGDAEDARQLLDETVGEIDQAAKKGVIHDNAAARYKSRLQRRVNAARRREQA